MKNNFICWLLSFLTLASCNNNAGKSPGEEKTDLKKNTALIKPASTYQDTLKIDFTAAVFYHPDSLQLVRIKDQVDSGVYDATMHEYFYQMRNARMIIKKNWLNVKIIEATNFRYLLFKKKNKETKIIDLDKKGDPHGLFLFNPKQDPEQIDMMNIDTALPQYFSRN